MKTLFAVILFVAAAVSTLPASAGDCETRCRQSYTGNGYNCTTHCY